MTLSMSLPPRTGREGATTPRARGQHAQRLAAEQQRSGAPGSPGGLLALQRLAGNSAVSKLAERDVVQRAGPTTTVSALAFAGAVPIPGVANTFVAPRKAAVVATATAANSDGSPVTARQLRWSVGASSGPVTRTFTGGGGRLRVRVRGTTTEQSAEVFFANAPALPGGAAPAPRLTHAQIGRSNPGTDFGLTVVTIGQQGVKSPTYTLNQFFAGVDWRFQVGRIRHGFKIGIASQGRRDVPSAAAVSPARAAQVITDLTPTPGAAFGPPRVTFWVRTFTQRHEEAHRDHFYLPVHGFWPASMATFATNTAAVTVPFAPGTAASAAQAKTLAKAGIDADIAAQHGVADAAEIGGSETFAHGISNPFYVALVAAIRASVRPPPLTALAAGATTSTSTTLTWTPGDPVIVTAVDVQRRLSGGPWTTVVAGLAPATGNFTDATLTPAGRFRYRVVAVGAAGRAPSREIQVRTGP